MKKLVLLFSLLSCSQLLMGSEVNCFSESDRQFHMAVGPEHISDFSFTSFATAKKLGRFLEDRNLNFLARSGWISIENEFCTENENEIKCDIVQRTTFTIFNVFGRAQIAKNGFVGELSYNKKSSKLVIELINSNQVKMKDEMTFSSSECQTTL
mgnify:CR=1 FL=1